MAQDPDAIYDEIRQHRKDMSNRVDDLETRVRSDAGEVKERVTDRVPDPVLHMGDRVSEHPLTYLAGGFGAGILLGMLSSGGGDDRRDMQRGTYYDYGRNGQSSGAAGNITGAASSLMGMLSGRLMGAVDDIVRPVVDDVVAGLRGDERRPEERDGSRTA